MDEKSPAIAPVGQIPQQNHLLAALPAGDYERLAPHLELIPLKLGEVLYEPGVRLRSVRWRTDGSLGSHSPSVSLCAGPNPNTLRRYKLGQSHPKFGTTDGKP